MTSIDLNTASHEVCSLVSALKNIRSILSYAEELSDKIEDNLDKTQGPIIHDCKLTIDLKDCDALNEELRSVRVDLSRALRFFK